MHLFSLSQPRLPNSRGLMEALKKRASSAASASTSCFKFRIEIRKDFRSISIVLFSWEPITGSSRWDVFDRFICYEERTKFRKLNEHTAVLWMVRHTVWTMSSIQPRAKPSKWCQAISVCIRDKIFSVTDFSYIAFWNVFRMNIVY